jgi:hypothetical protein
VVSWTPKFASVELHSGGEFSIEEERFVLPSLPDSKGYRAVIEA